MTRRAHKYGVAPRAERTADGIVFASKGEMKRWLDLRLLEKGGRIKNLRCQVPLRIAIPTFYVADFVYEEDGQTVFEDFKGYRTHEYKSKRKAVRDQYGIVIRETGMTSP